MVLRPDGNSALMIDQPGSYVLAVPVTAPAGLNAITITADNVERDLNGFNVNAGQGAHGIFLSEARNVTLRNGTVRDAVDSGIYCGGDVSLTLLDVNVLDNADYGVACTELRVMGGTFAGNGLMGVFPIGEGAQLDGIRVHDNQFGVQLGKGSVLIRAAVHDNTGFGVSCPLVNSALVSQTVAIDNGGGNIINCTTFGTVNP